MILLATKKIRGSGYLLQNILLIFYFDQLCCCGYICCWTRFSCSCLSAQWCRIVTNCQTTVSLLSLATCAHVKPQVHCHVMSWFVILMIIVSSGQLAIMHRISVQYGNWWVHQETIVFLWFVMCFYDNYITNTSVWKQKSW